MRPEFPASGGQGASGEQLHVVIGLASMLEVHGGPSRSVPALAQALQGRGIQVSLTVANDPPRGLMHYAARLAQNLRVMPRALLHDQGIWMATSHVAASVAHRAQVPFMVSPRGMLEPWALRHRRLKKQVAWMLYQRRDLKRAALIHVTSEAEAQHVRQLGLNQPIAVIPNGVDSPAELPPRTRHVPKRILFLSRLHPVKGLPLLIEAWRRTQPVGWELIVAGRGEERYERELKTQVYAAGLQETIRFVGAASETEKWGFYRSAEVFVLPTLSENFGLVVAEALAAGVPVITTTAAPWQALVLHRCGWWVKPEVDALVTALSEATSLTTAARGEMGDNGQAFVNAHLSWDHVAIKMAQVYTWILDGGDMPHDIYDG
jgi:glycosyltransferase involved in cell wall biosynthesis